MDDRESKVMVTDVKRGKTWSRRIGELLPNAQEIIATRGISQSPGPFGGAAM